MKKYSRVLAGILAVLLSAGCTGLYAAAQSDSSSAADSTASTTKNESDKKDTKDTKKADKSDSDTEKQAKEETVYVITDASGNKTKTVVSNWLKNPQGVKKLEDVSHVSLSPLAVKPSSVLTFSISVRSETSSSFFTPCGLYSQW